MVELTDYIARCLVDHPEEVDVREYRSGNRVTLELHVAKEDMGRIIGRNGRVVNAIRTLLRVTAEQANLRVNLDIIEP